MAVRPLIQIPSLIPRFARMQALAGMLSLGGVGLAIAGEPSGSVPGLANREIAKREAMLSEAQKLVIQAGALFDTGDYAGAMKADRDAWELLPDSPATAAIKLAARDGYSRAANAQARKLAGEARYAEANTLLESVLEDDFDPSNADAKLLKKQLGDPDRYNPALTPQHLKNVAEVDALLLKGNALLDLGDLDGASDRFNSVLRIDKFNTAARHGLERVEKFKTGYYASARDEVRAARLTAVNSMWEDQVPASLDVSGLFGGQSAGGGGQGGSGKEGILSKLRTFIVPSVDLQGATLEETVEFLRIRSRDLDPKRAGISFILRVPPEVRSKTVTLTMAQVPLDELLRYVTQMSGTAYRVDEFAVNITSMSEKTTALVTKSWRVPPDFITSAPAADAAAPAVPDPFAAKGKGAAGAPAAMQNLGLRRHGAREFLEQRGVAFPEGATASYNPGTNILFVQNTVENIAQIDDLIEQATGATPKLVEIRVRMLEVSESKLNELGFDWALGQFNIPGSSSVFASGGTVGNGRSGSFTNQEFPITGPDLTTPIGTNPITAGLRSSGAILGVPSIDGLIGLRQPVASDSRSPGQFALAGVFSDPQFQMVLRALSQKKGRDLMASPAVVTKSGQRASVVVAREFIYPTEFNPPQIPQNLSATTNQGNVTVIRVANFAPVTPSTPTAFAKRDVGITLEVEPVVAANNKSIDLNIAPSSTEFEGFINYGSDITNSAPIGIGGTRVFYTQPNPILQPVFRTNKGTSAVTIYDGATVAIASVITEKRQDINDKVPIVGNLPLVGRAFQSKVSQIERKNVMIFVTARLLDPGGNPINQPSATTAAAP